MEKKAMYYHLLSVVGLCVAALCFSLLGGATGMPEAPQEEQLNTEVPAAREQALAADRWSAMQKEQLRQDEESRRAHLEKNSFHWLEEAANPPEKKQTELQYAAPAPRKPKVRKEAAAAGSRVSSSEPLASVAVAGTPRRSKEEIMRQKRAEIEREIGINLSDYGYTKYADETALSVASSTADVPAGGSSLSAAEAEPPSSSGAGFHGISSEKTASISHIKAVVHGEHRNIAKGATVKLRLLESVPLEGCVIPRNSFVYGRLSFSDGRAMIRIENINYQDRILPFKASIFDRDGFEGIHVPENIVSDTKKKAASDALSGVDVRLSSTHALAGSAVNALSSAVKSAVQGSVREPKITISSNYRITIRKQP